MFTRWQALLYLMMNSGAAVSGCAIWRNAPRPPASPWISCSSVLLFLDGADALREVEWQSVHFSQDQEIERDAKPLDEQRRGGIADHPFAVFEAGPVSPLDAERVGHLRGLQPHGFAKQPQAVTDPFRSHLAPNVRRQLFGGV